MSSDPVSASGAGGAGNTARRPVTVHHEAIEEVAYQPAQAGGGGLGRTQVVLLLVAGLLALGTALALWFVFAARSVYVEVTPSPEQVVFADAGLKFQAGDRILTLPGPARVSASLEGYYPLDEVVEIDGRKSQTLTFELTRKPGYVTVVFGRDDVRDAVVRIDDQLVTTTPVELSSGQHDIAVDAPRFLPYRGRIDVIGGGQAQDVAIELAPDWADVRFVSTPPGADVLVDGVVRGQTPVVVPILTGAHDIGVKADGYKLWRRPLRARAGEPQAFADIVLEKADGLVSVVSRPPGAAVSVDGNYRGQAPLDLRLPPGQAYRIEVARSGFQTFARRVDVRDDRDEMLDVTLVALYGDVAFELAPATARVFVDGQPQSLTNGVLSLPATEQTLEIRADGHVTQTRTLTPNPAYAQTVSVSLLTIAAAREAAIPKTLTTGDGQSLILFNPYPFQMGASRRERGRRANEVLREIDNLPSFYLATHEVTNARFKAFRAEHESGFVYKESLDGAAHPVVNLTVRDAMAYCNWLSERDGLSPVYELAGDSARRIAGNGYRLPSEAEWAFAARYADQARLRRFPWGESMPPAENSGNYADRAAVGLTASTLKDYSDSFPGTAPVGSFPPNSAGLYDIGGNVAEWTDTRYTAGTPSTGGGEGEGAFYVARGSSWMHAGLSELRLTFRDFSDVGRPDIGFRIARDVEEPQL